MMVLARFAGRVATGARGDKEMEIIMSWKTVKQEQGVRGMVELQRYESGKGRTKFVSWQILCEGVKVDYASVKRDVEPNFQAAVAGDFRYGPECPAGDSCSGTAFPGHPAHAAQEA